MPALLICIAAVAIDGDSIRCRNLGEVRLLAIDSADYRRSRPCVGRFGGADAQPVRGTGEQRYVCDDRKALAGKRSMQRALKLGPVRVDPVTRDRYGRMVALVSAGGVDLSCHQLRAGVARYIGKYDNGGRVRRNCDVR